MAFSSNLIFFTFSRSSFKFCVWPTTSSIRLFNNAEISSFLLRLPCLEAFDGLVYRELLSLSNSIKVLAFLDFLLLTFSFFDFVLLDCSTTNMSSSFSVITIFDFYLDFLFLGLDFYSRLLPEDDPKLEAKLLRLLLSCSSIFEPIVSGLSWSSGVSSFIWDSFF